MNLFQTVCFLALMEGLESKAPSYIAEKVKILDSDIEYAFSRLDKNNQAKVVSYYNKWMGRLPKSIKREIKHQLEGA